MPRARTGKPAICGHCTRARMETSAIRSRFHPKASSVWPPLAWSSGHRWCKHASSVVLEVHLPKSGQIRTEYALACHELGSWRATIGPGVTDGQILGWTPSIKLSIACVQACQFSQSFQRQFHIRNVAVRRKGPINIVAIVKRPGFPVKLRGGRSIDGQCPA
jgi:hypothetical protein